MRQRAVLHPVVVVVVDGDVLKELLCLRVDLCDLQQHCRQTVAAI